MGIVKSLKSLVEVSPSVKPLQDELKKFKAELSDMRKEILNNPSKSKEDDLKKRIEHHSKRILALTDQIHYMTTED